MTDRARGEPADGVIVRNGLIKPKRIKQLLLLALQTPHHRPLPPSSIHRRVNHASRVTAKDFCNKICQADIELTTGHVRFRL
jgi:hypothetical protein